MNIRIVDNKSAPKASAYLLMVAEIMAITLS